MKIKYRKWIIIRGCEVIFKKCMTKRNQRPIFIWFPSASFERFDTNPDSYCNYAFIQTFFFFTFSHYNYFFSLTSWTIRNRREVWRHFYYVFFSFTTPFVFHNATGFWPPISCQCLKMIVMDFSLTLSLLLPLKARYYHQQWLNLCLQIVKKNSF